MKNKFAKILEKTFIRSSSGRPSGLDASFLCGGLFVRVHLGASGVYPHFWCHRNNSVGLKAGSSCPEINLKSPRSLVTYPHLHTLHSGKRDVVLSARQKRV